ncbi:LysM peptidoglycan-binding domain-containing protein [Anaerolineales bacterium HSG25]|nr:LysM peptidoglycan-binding domain-containing protein [Anaerolineales bacterium HSG25]
MLLLSGCGRFARQIVEQPTSDMIAVGQLNPTATLDSSTETPIIPTKAVVKSPTILPSPTPELYTVQEGDTILSIAAAFNRATANIQAVNGLINPQSLTVGQILVIPPADKVMVAGGITATPLPLVIQSVHFEEDASGALWCLGEVLNHNRVNLSEVQVEATLIDQQGVILARSTAFTQLSVVALTEAVPFIIQFSDPPESFAQYQVTVIAATPFVARHRAYLDFEVLPTEATFITVSQYRIEGRLHNQGKHDAQNVHLVAVAYNAKNEIIAQRQTDIEVSRFKAGANIDFTIDLTIKNNTVDHYRILAQGLRIE